ncbi:hypothetical protein CUJ83_00845 [Methanocella sp. CWC-04]|uniref:histidine kinase n=1 Tax=Methanooceanicella nereidis TaxID=2052831 RepID=A0AAP2RA57_9EURY|nr:PAS domain-containing sensor histidine kinase [Methanocella sp. CWC-04]MCD1293543.1 hypothetical protein [Methanocella sp. CWC-04]
MDINILQAKGVNKFSILLIAAQLCISMVLVAMLVFSIVGDLLSIITVISAVLLNLFCLPLSLLLYRSSKDEILQKIFLGLSMTFALLTISGVIWYILPLVLDLPWLEQAAKLLTIISYAPITISLYNVYKARDFKIEPWLQILIFFINFTLAVWILFFTAIYFDINNLFDVSIYAGSMIIDIVLLTMTSILVLAYMPNQLRYLFSIIFIFEFFSFLGDSLSLVGYLGLFDTTGHAQLFYDLMLISISAGLLVYSLCNIKITTVEEVNKKLSDTRQLMYDLIMQSPDATCIFNTNGDIVLMNNMFIKIFDVSGPYLERSFNLFKNSENLGDNIKQKIMRVMNGETVVLHGVKLFSMKDKDRFTFNTIKIFPVFTSDKKISSYITIVQDLTELKRYEDELVQAKSQAELYIDLMSHDINNMNQIGLGYLEMAMDSISDNEKRILLERSYESMINSTKLIDNVKKVRSVNENNMFLEPIDLGKVLNEVLIDCKDFPEREVNIEYNIEEGSYVLANPLIKDVFTNLINNAVKHSYGSVKISVGSDEFFIDGKKYYRITVEDNGPGVSDEMKPVIFDRLYRSRSRTGGGGLGLYLVKTLLEKFDGTIKVEDRVPGDRTMGSRFVVMMPAIGACDGRF